MKVDRDIFRSFITGFSLRKLKKSVLIEKVPNKEFTLEAQIEQARSSWLVALDQMQWADDDMLDAAILYANACEKKYMALLHQARSQGFTAWDINHVDSEKAAKYHYYAGSSTASHG